MLTWIFTLQNTHQIPPTAIRMSPLESRDAGSTGAKEHMEDAYFDDDALSSDAFDIFELPDDSDV